MILPREALVAEIAPAAVAWSIAERLDAVDDTADFAGSTAWCRAASDVLGDANTAHVVFRDGSGTAVGWTMLERGAAGWRSGAPGASCVSWPFAAIGYRFRPRFLVELAPALRATWIQALRSSFRGRRLELVRLDPEEAAVEVEHAHLDRADGPATWATKVSGDADGWYATLDGKHRRDLKKYRRDIAAFGGEWCDTLDGAPLGESLDVLFALHRRRIAHKGATSACGTPRSERFLRRLAEREAAAGTRVVVVRHGGEPMGACLSFAHRRRLKVTVSGWDQGFSRYDLGRQVIHHQILREFERGLVEIDLLGGDLPYKREFGLERRPTVDLVVRPSAFAALREDLVHGAIEVVRAGRRPVGAGAKAKA
ncbi:MAG: GNAT family N-acetyltransferase [Planctomycetes bacterium]|nr:GNAT family N-acetyltransferase [Planctomycetota bacterium]